VATGKKNVLSLERVGKLIEMLTLHLIRHAKTHQHSPTGKDKDRELMEKGTAQANLLGHYLQSHHIELGKMLCSSATRTRQTKSIICQHLAERCRIEFRDKLYMASKEDLLTELSGETERTITLIGHNDGISELASYFAEEYIGMRTAEFVTFTFPLDNWSMIFQGTGTITLRYRPEVFLPA
jgi:phosphohistidine phosphatase